MASQEEAGHVFQPVVLSDRDGLVKILARVVRRQQTIGGKIVVSLHEDLGRTPLHFPARQGAPRRICTRQVIQPTATKERSLIRDAQHRQDWHIGRAGRRSPELRQDVRRVAPDAKRRGPTSAFHHPEPGERRLTTLASGRTSCTGVMNSTGNRRA